MGHRNTIVRTISRPRFVWFWRITFATMTLLVLIGVLGGGFDEGVPVLLVSAGITGIFWYVNPYATSKAKYEAKNRVKPL